MSARESPQKYSTSPAGSRAGLRSGATPQKLRQILTTPKKSDSPARVNPLLEIEPNSPAILKPSMTEGNSRSLLLPVSPPKTPSKRPVVVLQRQDFPDTNSGSPAKSPVKKPSHLKSPASPVDTTINSEVAEQILSPRKQRPKKSLIVTETALTPDREMRSRHNAGKSTPAKNLLYSSSVYGMVEGNLSPIQRCGQPLVVIVLEDFECFSGPLLQDLITICG